MKFAFLAIAFALFLPAAALAEPTVCVTMAADDPRIGVGEKTTVHVYAEVLNPAAPDDGLFSYDLNVEFGVPDIVAIDPGSIIQPGSDEPQSPGDVDADGLVSCYATYFFDQGRGVAVRQELFRFQVTGLAEGQVTVSVLPDDLIGTDFLLHQTEDPDVDYAAASLAIAVGEAVPLEITATLDHPWVYQNTAATTGDRHKSVLTVEILSGAEPGQTYAITIGQDGHAVTDFQVTQPVAITPGTPQTVNVLGGRRDISTAGNYTLNVTVAGTPGGLTATANVSLILRKLGDIDGDGAVTASDKLEMNKSLNGLATLPGIGLRELDLTGDGTTVNAEDKLAINQVLNGLVVP